MVTQAEYEEIRRDLLQEHFEEQQREDRLHHDELFAIEQLTDNTLSKIYDQLDFLVTSLSSYGWNVSTNELIGRLKERTGENNVSNY